MLFCPEKIRLARTRKGLSLERLANSLAAPIAGETLRNYENGITCPDINTLINIADVLDEELSFFLSNISIQLDGANNSAPESASAASGATNTPQAEG